MYGSAWAGYGFLWLEMRIQRCTVVSQGRQAIDRRILSALHGSLEVAVHRAQAQHEDGIARGGFGRMR